MTEARLGEDPLCLKCSSQLYYRVSLLILLPASGNSVNIERLCFNIILFIVFSSFQRQVWGGSVSGFETGLGSSLYHTEAFTWQDINAEKLHPQAKRSKSGSRAVMPGSNQHLHFSLNHQWLLNWPLVTEVQAAEGFYPFLCLSPPLPVCLSSFNTCSSLSLLPRWPNFPAALKVTHTHAQTHTAVSWKWVWQCRKSGGKGSICMVVTPRLIGCRANKQEQGSSPFRLSSPVSCGVLVYSLIAGWTLLPLSVLFPHCKPISCFPESHRLAPLWL